MLILMLIYGFGWGGWGGWCAPLQGLHIHTALFLILINGFCTHNVTTGNISNVISTGVGTHGSGLHSHRV